MVAALSDLIRIPSINPRYPGEDYEQRVGIESVVTRHLATLFERAGCEVDLFAVEPGRDNCVGRIRGAGTGRSLIFNGHVDVVPPGPIEDWIDGEPFSGRVSNGRIHGRGATDMKGGIVAFTFAAIALNSAGVRLAGDLILESVVGEETMEHNLGTTACIERGYRADGAVVAEASAPPTTLGVVPATPGLLRFILTVEGKRTHPAMRGQTIHAGGGGWDVGVNAIDKGFLMYEALARREREWALTKRHPLFAPGQFGMQPGVFVGSPRGQLDPFFIPDLARLDYILIYHPEDDAGAVRKEIEELVADVAHLDGWLRQHPPQIEWKSHWPPSVVPAGHPLVIATSAAHERATGTPAEIRGWTAMHDGTFLNAAGIPAICYGPGDIRVAHAPNESLAIDELVLAAKTYAALAIEWCGLSPVPGG
jgi:acetylornithine deacetylase